MEIIMKPILSEKMSMLTDKLNKVAFVVADDANKIEIKKTIEKMYDVKVKTVNVQRYQGKVKSRYTKSGVITGRTDKYKKAIVTLEDGHSIDFFSNI